MVRRYVHLRHIQDIFVRISSWIRGVARGFRFREKCKIIYTGSLIYHIECDVCTTSWNVISIDTSDYSSDNAYSIPLENKKIPDFMKDENNGAIIIHRA